MYNVHISRAIVMFPWMICTWRNADMYVLYLYVFMWFRFEDSINSFISENKWNKFKFQKKTHSILIVGFEGKQLKIEKFDFSLLMASTPHQTHTINKMNTEFKTGNISLLFEKIKEISYRKRCVVIITFLPFRHGNARRTTTQQQKNRWRGNVFL